jgi:undecaprenyl-diphosphatase
MNALIRLVADYALFAVALGALVCWLRTPRQDRLPYAVAAVIAVALVAVAVKGLGALWVDPRPFVVDHTTPLIAHSPDNGFPSDHTALATAVAAVTLAWHRRSGVVLLAVAFALAVARVAAQVHHVPDILGGITAGLLAALIASLVARRIPWRRLSPDHQARPLAGTEDQATA